MIFYTKYNSIRITHIFHIIYIRFISNNILAGFEHNKTIKIVGLPWQKHETYNLFSRKALVSNILCTKHNEMLSPFDSEMGRFINAIKDFDGDFNNENPKSEIAVFSGENLEKWMLKTACAFIAAELILANGNKVRCIMKDDYVDILFNNKPFPSSWGLYFKNEDVIHKYDTVSINPMTHRNELKAIEFWLNNFKFYLLLDRPDNPDAWGIYRLRGMEFKHQNILKTLEICWQDKQYNKGIFLSRRMTTNEFPKGWDDYLKK